MDRNPLPLNLTLRSSGIGVAGSLIFHVAGYALLAWATALPTLGLEFELPTEVEFGISEATVVAPPEVDSAPEVEAPPEPEPEPEQPEQPGIEVEADDPGEDAPKKPDAGPKPQEPAPPDAGAPEPEPEPEAEPETQVKTPDGGVAAAPDAGRPVLERYAPPGAQLALRLHMGRVRASPLAVDVQAVLDAVPDWNLVVGGSGIEPMADLEKLYLASPNLDRSRLLIAGEYVGEDEVAKKAVAALALARKKPAQWRTQGSFEVAPWHNRDRTQRMVALIGERQFAITRPEDLSRILAVAEALVIRKHKASEQDNDPVDAPEAGDALLGLEEGELLSFSVEGARQFVPRQKVGVPSRFEAKVKQGPDGEILVDMVGVFDTEGDLKKAFAFWQDTRKRFMRHPTLAFLGLGGPLKRATFVSTEDRLEVKTTLNVQQVRMLLGFVRNALKPLQDQATGDPGDAHGAPPQPSTKKARRQARKQARKEARKQARKQGKDKPPAP